jgi:N6-adenosine-specific RNA methylase IME4
MYVTSLDMLIGCNYEIISADPCWTYTNKGVGGSGTSGAHLQYPVMGLTEIAALPVNAITAENSVLFLWVTMPLLRQAFTVMDAWGFTYKTNAFTWVKTNKKAASLFWGMGFWTRSNAELCLLGVKGKPKRIAANVHSVIQSPIEAHSRKPSCTLDRIVTLMGDRPRLEMFARGDRCDGWDRFGNEP